MYFYMPVKVYEEEHCVAHHAKELAAFGKKALIVTGSHSAKANGSLDDVTDALKKEGVSYAVFSEIEENPSVETVMKARDFGVQEQADFVIGIGGGSPMDAAKAISLMMKHKDRDWTFMYDKTAPTSTLPVVEVPTTCGTGSEVTAISVLTRHDLKTKGSIPHHIFADLALVDGRYLEKAPHSVIVNTSMDALCHLMESAVNTKATDISREIVYAGLSIWKRSKEVALQKREASAEDRMNMMNASMFAGMAIAHTGTSLPHGMSYSLTYTAHMAHGKACGYFLPGYLREADTAEVGSLLQAADFRNLKDLEAYYEATCGRDEVDVSVLEHSMKTILDSPSRMEVAPFRVDETVLRRIAGIS